MTKTNSVKKDMESNQIVLAKLIIDCNLTLKIKINTVKI